MNDCLICLEQINNTQNYIKFTPKCNCVYTLHYDCAMKWLLLHKQCIICNKYITPIDYTYYFIKKKKKPCYKKYPCLFIILLLFVTLFIIMGAIFLQNVVR